MGNNTCTQSATADCVKELLAAVRRGGRQDRYAGKRKSSRFSDGSLLDMTTDPNDPSALHTVYLHNLSESGFAFWARMRLEPHAAVFIRCSDEGDQAWIPGRVTHCTHGLRGFLVGGQFQLDPAKSR